MIITDPQRIDPVQLESRTGWSITPEGACRGEICVPLSDGPVSATELSERLGMAIVTDDEHGLTALGPASFAGQVLTSVEVPDLELLDFDGVSTKLADVRGNRTVVVSWAPW